MIEGLKEDVQYGVLIQAVTADVQLGPASDPAFGTPRNRSKCLFAVCTMIKGQVSKGINPVLEIFELNRSVS